MRYFADEKWRRLPLADFRPRFFVETYLEKLSMHTPHFYQSRLMNVFSSCSELIEYIDEYSATERNAGYILSALDEVDDNWERDSILNSLCAHMNDPRKQLFKVIRGGDLGQSQRSRLRVFCEAVTSRQDDYVSALLSALSSALLDKVDLSQTKRIAENIYSLTGLYVTHLLNRGYSPTYLFNRSEQWTRENNYSGKTFNEQFQFVTDRLRTQRITFEVYYAVRAHRPAMLLDIADDEDFQFLPAIPDCIQHHESEKLTKGIEPNVIAKATIESTDYVSAAWRVKEKLDRLFDATTALELNPRIETSAHAVVIGKGQPAKTLNIDLLLSFLSSESGTFFSGSEASIRHALTTLNEGGREHLRRSLRYLRLARNSISLEQKLLNLWIALESLFADGESTVLPSILDHVPQIYAISSLRRRVNHLRELLIRNEIPTTGLIRKAIVDLPAFCSEVTEAQIFRLLRNRAAALELFDSLGEKEHLKFKLVAIFDELKSNSEIGRRIKQTESDVTRQLRRIYFLRNKMAHTGHYGNIRPQLVMHLLDYLAGSYVALCESASVTARKQRHSISDLLAAYKFGADAVVMKCRSGREVAEIQDLVPSPII